MVREQNRLRTLQMSVAWHDNIAVFLSSLNQSLLHVEDQLLNLYSLTADKHMSIKGYLIIAAAGSMKPAASITNSIGKALLDIHMDIFKGNLKGEIALFNFLIDILKAGNDVIPILFGNDSHLGKHGCMGYGACNILIVHALVKINRGLEIIYHLIGGLGKAATPELLCHITYLPFPA